MAPRGFVPPGCFRAAWQGPSPGRGEQRPGVRLDGEEHADTARVSVGVDPRGGGAAAAFPGVGAVAQNGALGEAGGGQPPGAPGRGRRPGRRRGCAGGARVLDRRVGGRDGLAKGGHIRGCGRRGVAGRYEGGLGSCHSFRREGREGRRRRGRVTSAYCRRDHEGG